MRETMRKQEVEDEHFKDSYSIREINTTESAERITTLSSEPLDWPLWTKVSVTAKASKMPVNII